MTSARVNDDDVRGRLGVRVKTISEQLFEQFCANHSLELFRVEPPGIQQGVRIPDYEIRLRDVTIITEIKEISPSKEDRKELERLAAVVKRNSEKPDGEDREPISWARTIGERVSNSIKKAAPQLKARVKDQPALVIVYDNMGFYGGDTEGGDMLAAMGGAETWAIDIPRDPMLQPQVAGVSFGFENVTSPGSNTTISAVAALDVVSDGMSLRCFHNRYAKHKLDPDLLRYPNIRHFTLPTSVPPKQLQKWIEI